MPTPYAKIAITLPPEDLAAADRLAIEHDRSRSWIIAEALRQYVARADAAAALDPARREQVARDMALSASQRLLEAEAAARVVGRSPVTGQAGQPLTFDTYDDFLAWQRARTQPR